MSLRLLLGAAALMFLAARGVIGQSVDPPFEVHIGRASSSFAIRNNSLFPLTYVIEPRSFDIASCGDLNFLPIDSARVRVRLSNMSGRLPAQQQRRIQYELSADSLPAWVAFVITFGSAGRDPGLGTRLEMVHFAYLNQRAPVVSDEVVVLEARFDPVHKRVTVSIRNTSDKLTRVRLMSLVDRAGGEHPVEACPFLPRHTRSIDVPWTRPDPPVKVVIQLVGFTLEAPIVIRPPADSVALPPR